MIPNEKLAGSLKDAPIERLARDLRVADLARLAKPHARVKVTHTGPQLNPMVLNPMAFKDRHEQYHQLRPGESVEVEMLVDEVAHFRELRKPGRMISRQVQIGELYVQKMVEAPLHPLLIEEV